MHRQEKYISNLDHPVHPLPSSHKLHLHNRLVRVCAALACASDTHLGPSFKPSPPSAGRRHRVAQQRPLMVAVEQSPTHSLSHRSLYHYSLSPATQINTHTQLTLCKRTAAVLTTPTPCTAHTLPQTRGTSGARTGMEPVGTARRPPEVWKVERAASSGHTHASQQRFAGPGNSVACRALAQRAKARSCPPRPHSLPSCAQCYLFCGLRGAEGPRAHAPAKEIK